jgi:UV DNA damage endonuclease
MVMHRLGLVCMTESDEVRFRTLTRTRLQKLSPGEQRDTLRTLYQANADSLRRGVEFCHRHQIPLFRIASDLFPFADTDEGEAVLGEFAATLAEIGKRAEGLRLVMHPDQYVVLSSDRPDVVDNARRVLHLHGVVLDLLGQPRSPWAAVIIHGGKGDRSQQLATQVQALPDNIRTRLVLENDERAYGASDILAVCKDSGVPMVFDAHHHVIHDELASYEDRSVGQMLDKAAQTWPQADWQLVHISNGREGFSDMRHSDLISVMPSCYRRAPWIEVEAKAKERAIFSLRAQGWA